MIHKMANKDVLRLIMVYSDDDVLNNLIQSSNVATEISKENNFWKLKVEYDYDVKSEDVIDWRHVYQLIRENNGILNETFKNATKYGHTEVVKLLLDDKRVDPSANHNYAINRRAADFDLHRRCKVFERHQKMVIRK
jgi:hypothetical protein